MSNVIEQTSNVIEQTYEKNTTNNGKYDSS